MRGRQSCLADCEQDHSIPTGWVRLVTETKGGLRPSESWGASAHPLPTRSSPAMAASRQSHFSLGHLSYPCRKKWPKGRFSSGPFSSTKCGGLSRRVLPFHYHRHCTHMNFTTVLGMDVLQHRLSGQRSWVSNASFKVLDAFCVSAGTTDEARTPIISTDAVHIAKAYTRSSGVRVINFTCWVIVILIRCGTNALGTAHQRSVALRHVHHKQKHCICRQHYPRPPEIRIESLLRVTVREYAPSHPQTRITADQAMSGIGDE